MKKYLFLLGVALLALTAGRASAQSFSSRPTLPDLDAYLKNSDSGGYSVLGTITASRPAADVGAVGWQCGNSPWSATVDLYCVSQMGWARNTNIASSGNIPATSYYPKANGDACQMSPPPGIPPGTAAVSGAQMSITPLQNGRAFTGLYQLIITSFYKSATNTMKYDYNYTCPPAGAVRILWRKSTGTGTVAGGRLYVTSGAGTNFGYAEFTPDGYGVFQSNQFPQGTHSATVAGTAQTNQVIVTFPMKVPMYGMINTYTVVFPAVGNGTPTIEPGKNNTDPDDTSGPVPTPTPSPGSNGGSSTGGEYDGPPGDGSWWSNMLKDAFVPQESTVNGLRDDWQALSSWGPFGFVGAITSAFSGGNVSHACGLENPECAPVISLGGINLNGETLESGQGQFSGNDIVLDLRRQGQTYADGSTGTAWGDIAWWARRLIGGMVYVIGCIAFIKVLTPKPTS